MNNVFELTFDKALTKLVGKTFGKVTFQSQVKDEIDYNQKIIIKIPERIDNISSSFIQGFFEQIIDNIGLKGLENNVKVESSIPNVMNYIVDNIF